VGDTTLERNDACVLPCGCHDVFHSLKTIVSTSCSSVSLYQFLVVNAHHEKHRLPQRLHTGFNRTAGTRDSETVENLHFIVASVDAVPF
jgi:hypothetical protein